MSAQLTPDHVSDFLAPFGIQVQRLAADTSTASLAASALGTTVAAIVKSLLFVADGTPVLILAAGDRKVDRRRVALLCGAPSARLAKPDEVLEMTGYAIGGVPPVAHATALQVLMDASLLRHETVYAAAGAGNAIFAVPAARLAEIAGARVVDVTE